MLETRAGVRHRHHEKEQQPNPNRSTRESRKSEVTNLHLFRLFRLYLTHHSYSLQGRKWSWISNLNNIKSRYPYWIGDGYLIWWWLWLLASLHYTTHFAIARVERASIFLDFWKRIFISSNSSNLLPKIYYSRNKWRYLYLICIWRKDCISTCWYGYDCLVTSMVVEEVALNSYK